MKELLETKIKYLKSLQYFEVEDVIQTAFEKGIEFLQDELNKLPVDEAEYQEHMAEVINNQRELENEQR